MFVAYEICAHVYNKYIKMDVNTFFTSTSSVHFTYHLVDTLNATEGKKKEEYIY